MITKALAITKANIHTYNYFLLDHSQKPHQKSSFFGKMQGKLSKNPTVRSLVLIVGILRLLNWIIPKTWGVFGNIQINRCHLPHHADFSFKLILTI